MSRFRLSLPLRHTAFITAAAVVTSTLTSSSAIPAKPQASIVLTAKPAPPTPLMRIHSAAHNVCENTKSAVYVINGDTGETLINECGDTVLHPASLAKLMTIYKIFKAVKAGSITFDTEIPVSDHARFMERNAGLKHGARITYGEAVDGMVIKSWNDLAEAPAEALAQDAETFAAGMTQEGVELGLKDTVFRNPSGLPDKKQVTTARDMVILMRALRYNFPEYYKRFKIEELVFRGKKYDRHDDIMFGGQGLAGDSRITGDKTGYTIASGYNIAFTATANGHTIVGVVLGAPTRKARARLTLGVVDKSFALSEKRTLIAAATP